MKREKIIIKGDAARKSSKGAYLSSFKTGAHMTKKDRPRQKIKPKDMHKYL